VLPGQLEVFVVLSGNSKEKRLTFQHDS